MRQTSLLSATAMLCAGTMAACSLAGPVKSGRRVLVEQKRLDSDVHPSLAASRNPRILYVMLKLRDDTVASDERIVESLRGLRGFTHIMLKASSLHETPDAIHDSSVRRAIEICRKEGIQVLWGRNLWVSWPREGEKVPTTESLFEAAYYSAALATVRAEARALGVAGTFLDVEPYGRSPQIPLKRNALTHDEQKRVLDAVKAAVLNAGRVDLIFPASSPRSGWFVWALNEMGTLHCENRTYYARRPEYKFPRIRPPDGKQHRVDFWGINVGLRPTGREERKFIPLTVDEFEALDLGEMRRRYPECRGTWVYIDYKIFPQVLRSWKK